PRAALCPSTTLFRSREIGILRSLGATGRRVAAVFWTEALALSALAWSLAVVVGIPASLAFVNLIAAVLIPISFAFDPAALLAMLDRKSTRLNSSHQI